MLSTGCFAAALAAQEPAPPPPTQKPAEPQASPPAEAPTPAVHGPQGFTWEVEGYTIKLGGYVKVDLIHDFDPIGSTDTFDPRTIPTTGESGVNTRLHARQTRFNLDVRGPTSIGPMRVFFEGDFFGSSSTFRIRHAYGEIAGFLAGQTWTTFMDDDAMPETIDFESPIAFPMVRQAMIRYTQPFGGGSYGAIALEDPDSDVIPPPVPGRIEKPTPDLTGRLRWEHGCGHTQLGLFAGTARYNYDSPGSDTVFLWGLNASTKLMICERDNLIVQLTYGPGVGRYRGGHAAAPDANGQLEAVEVFGVMAAYQHHWCSQWRSTATYSWGKGDLPAGSPADANEVLQYLSANVIWQFCDRAWVGLEYLYGTRETFDDADGDAHRIQIAMRFNL